jgi:hypothetical protein
LTVDHPKAIPVWNAPSGVIDSERILTKRKEHVCQDSKNLPVFWLVWDPVY